MNKLEVLAPAGDEERLTAALNYGADAVYLRIPNRLRPTSPASAP